MKWEASIRARLGPLGLDVALKGGDSPIALIGPNGSGKTTLLRMIAGARRPSSGQILLGDRVLFDSEQGIDLLPEQRRVGYVPQGYALFPHLSVMDNVSFGLGVGPRAVARADRRRSALALLESLGVGHLATRLPAALSGGEQQRVALARALIVTPDLLLLDEPLSALDAITRRTMRAFLAAHLKDRARPTLLVTHDVRDVLALEAEVFVLNQGSVVQWGSAAALRARPATDFVAEFFDAPA